jgi:outer membrane protein assembly factor BamC
MKLKHSVLTLPSIAAVALTLSACGTYSDKKAMDYRSASSQQVTSLEVPPDLTSPTAEDRFVVPANKSATTYSAYSRDRGAQPTTPTTGSAVLPKVENAGMVRAGDQRWLVVFGTPDKIWPAVREFWLENGFVLKREHPELGIMETDWAENRAKIPMDPVRRTVGKVFDNMWSTSERDKFRTRLEAGSQAGTTEIFVSHRGIAEIYPNEYKDSTIWQPRLADRELEAEMLSRILVKLGFDDRRAAQTVASAAPAAGTAEIKATYDKAGAGPLRVTEPFDRAWRRVGLALDRVGFTVEDRDRAKGVYFVRYIDPEADPKGEKGFLAKLAFWRKDAEEKPQYRILVAEASGVSTVNVQNAKGEPETSSTGKRILGLLYDQLK